VEAAQSVNYFTLFQNAGESVRFSAGDVVFRQGDPGDLLYVIRSGTVTLSVDGQTVETLGANGMFGEMALIHADWPRSGTATAATDIDLVPVDLKRFRRLVADTPFFAETVMKVMADRLRRQSGAPAT
jgi:CRP/FNR family transcriptional regulator, cyclic AMP receptor protein